jgi:hypothetical protein
MNEWLMVALVTVLTPVLLTGCDAHAPPAKREATWIDDGDEQQTAVLARHLRGLDVAMIEIDYRFAELYHAGVDGNWPYAEYQVGKLQLAMDLALERRPARAPSARALFSPALDRVNRAVEATDRAAFTSAMNVLAESCRGCHSAENVPSFGVSMPPQRRSSIIPP